MQVLILFKTNWCRLIKESFHSNTSPILVKNTMANHDLFNILKPALLLRKYFGYLSFKLEENNGPRYLKKSNVHFVLWCITQTFLVSLTAKLYWTSIQYYSNLNSVLEWMNYLLYYVLDFALFVHGVFTSKFYNYQVINVLNRMAMVENKLNTFGFTLDHDLNFKILSIFLFHVTVNVVHLVTLSYADYDSVKDIYETIFRTFITLIVDYAQISQVILFCGVILVTNNILDKLREVVYDDLDNRYNSTNINQQRFMIEISKAYQEIFEILREYLQTISCNILLQFAMTFAVIIFHVFNLVMLIFHYDFDVKYMTTVWFSTFLLIDATVTIILYVIMSETYHNKVS